MPYLRVCKCKRQLGEKIVQNDLALTASQMKQLVDAGEPINGASMDLSTSSNNPNPSWDVALENQRGTDIADLYMLQQETRRNIYKSYQDEKKFQEEKAKYEASLEQVNADVTTNNT